jgi:ParB/RepB/Spo0J family partition protein
VKDDFAKRIQTTKQRNDEMSTQFEDRIPDEEREIELALVMASPWNRKTFDEQSIKALAQSMQRHGLRDRIQVREHEDGHFGLISGERRVRAARMLGWQMIKAVVCDLDDETTQFLVLEHQVQSVDWPPSEKGVAVNEMYELRGDDGRRKYTLTQIADRLHVSNQDVLRWHHVARCPVRLKMAIDAGDVSSRVAGMVMQIADVDERNKAVEMILKPSGKAEPMTINEAQHLVENHFCRSLRGVAFDVKNPDLVPVVMVGDVPSYGGPCATCASCSATRHDEEEDARGVAMICYRVTCFAAKLRAASDELKRSAVEAGAQVMPREELVKIFDRGNGDLLESSGYVDVEAKADPHLDGHTNQAIMKQWKVLLKGKPPVEFYFALNPITAPARSFFVFLSHTLFLSLLFSRAFQWWKKLVAGKKLVVERKRSASFWPLSTSTDNRRVD